MSRSGSSSALREAVVVGRYEEPYFRSWGPLGALVLHKLLKDSGGGIRYA